MSAFCGQVFITLFCTEINGPGRLVPRRAFQGNKFNELRAFGDFSFKSKAGLQAHEQAVNAVPDIKGKFYPSDPRTN